MQAPLRILLLLCVASAALADDGGSPAAIDAGGALVPTEEGTAVVVEAKDDGSDEELPPGFAATYHEQESPLVFRVPMRGRTPEERAKAASAALGDAIELSAAAKEPPEPTVLVEDGRATVKVGAHIITVLHDDDARAEGLTLEKYAEQLEARLKVFVPAQVRRQATQGFFLHLFLSVLFGVVGFLTLRGLRNAFDRWDAEVDEKRGSFKPISVLRMPVFSGEAVGGALAFALATGRVLAYVATAVATMVAILSQFALTRPLLERLVRWSAGPVLDGVEIVITAIPGLLLAAGLVVALQAGLRVLNILLDGVASKSVHWKRLPPERVPVFRFSASAVAVLLCAPLLVAAAFGRWGTPLETLALSGGLAVVVAAVPLLSSYVVGVVTLWRAVVRPGDWVEVGRVSGEVTRVGIGELHLVPESGGTIGVPMVYLLFHPLRRLSRVPEASVDVVVARRRPTKELLEALRATVVVVDNDARVELVELARACIKVRISAPAVRKGVREQLLLALSAAVERDELELASLDGADPAREA